MTPAKRWTVLVMIAGDNDLDQYGNLDIEEMKRVGSTAEVDVVVQHDGVATGPTRRYHLHRDTALTDDLVAEIPETNTGDPAVATDFFRWGIECFPSEKVLAVLWNHGSGIDERDVYERFRGRGTGLGGPHVERGVVRSLATGGLRQALFDTTRNQFLVRGIAYDDAARDFLDNAELRQVLANVTAPAGRRIDVVGFDACLMSMLESAYELRGFARFIVGSEEVEPEDGWQYEAVLRMLTERPEAEPAEVAAGLVRAYLDSYSDARGVTQSALNLDRVNPAVEAVDRLGAACAEGLVEPGDWRAIMRAARHVQRFDIVDFADLGDFCTLLIAESASNPIREAAEQVLAAVTGEGGLVADAGWKGPGVERSTGVAVYLPIRGDATLVYDRLEFTTATRWDEFLAAYRSA